jgi:hypothetical protein
MPAACDGSVRYKWFSGRLLPELQAVIRKRHFPSPNRAVPLPAWSCFRPPPSACWPRGEVGVLAVVMITFMEQGRTLLAGLIAASPPGLAER